jgi:alpha-1,3/alpha-1,6-mannosyltransferase
MRRTDISVVIIGDGEEYERLLDLARTRLVSTSIIFKKNVSDSEMVKTLQESVALIHAAEEEPFGLTPVEAMACGTPVIAIRGGGPAETIIHGETGYLCEAATPAELEIAINSVLEQKEQGALGKLPCVERAKLFSWRSATDSLENIFNSLVHTDGRGAS